MTDRDRDDKFAHLLQPIRDLAANWNINIANELAEYLEVLEGLTFSFKGAALVIQGSACVYSKKVEYLHSLVYQALEFVAERKVKAIRSKATSDANAADDDEFDDEEHFLSLDDTLEEGTEIDLADDDGMAEEPLHTRLPATLLALEDAGLGEGDGEAGNYRIASCAVHHSGALLLEARDGFFLDENLRPLAPAAAAVPPALTAAGDAAVPSGELQAMQNGDDFDDAGADAEYFDGGMDDYPMDDGAPQLPSPEWGNPIAAPAPGQQLEQDEEEEEFDPYKPLNPSNAGMLQSKPYKKMKRIAKKPRIRSSLLSQRDCLPVQAVADGLLTLPAPATGLIFPEFNYAWQQIQQEDARQSQKKSKVAATVAGTMQHGGTAANNGGGVFTLEEAEALAVAAAEDDMDDIPFDPGYYDDDVDIDVGGDGAVEEPGDVDFGDITAAAEAAAWGAGPSLSDMQNNAQDGDISYEELVRAHVEALISAAAATEVQTELAARVSSWRTKMAPVLEEEDTRPEFDIHAYGERILDGLAGLSVSGDGVEEKKAGKKGNRKGDATKTGKPGIDARPVHFNEVVTGTQADQEYDVPRMFSSMLQLVNNGNLSINKINDSTDNFEITLLSTELKHQRIVDYRAPSSMEVAEGEDGEAGPSNAAMEDPNAVGGEEEGENLNAVGARGKKTKASKRQKA